MLLFGVYLLSEDPPIISIPDIGIPHFIDLIPERLNVHMLVFPMWTKEPVAEVLKAAWQLRGVRRRPMTWVCNTELEARRLALVGYRTLWCHQNCYCDETLNRIMPREKRYDAVYTAVVEPYKRLHLAAGVKSLKVLTRTQNPRERLAALGLGHADFNEKPLDPQRVAESLNECRCGLALSEREGGMFAFTEYLLCGLPVVSTPSKGGRDVFMTETNTRLVPPDVEAVASGVRHFLEEPVNPDVIREEVLRRMRTFRAILADTVAGLSGHRPFDPETMTGRWFRDRFISSEFLKEFMDSYTGSKFERLRPAGASPIGYGQLTVRPARSVFAIFLAPVRPTS